MLIEKVKKRDAFYVSVAISLLVSLFVTFIVSIALTINYSIPQKTAFEVFNSLFYQFFFFTPLAGTALLFIFVVLGDVLDDDEIKAMLAGGFYGGIIATVIFSVIASHVEWLPLLAFTVMVAEISYIWDKRKPKTVDEIMKFTLKNKVEHLVESFACVGFALTTFTVREDIIKFFVNLSPLIIQILIVIGTIVLVVVGIYGYVWVNALKFKGMKDEEEKNKIKKEFEKRMGKRKR